MKFEIMRTGRRNGKLVELKKKLEEMGLEPVFINSPPLRDRPVLEPIPDDLRKSVYDRLGIKLTDPNTACGSAKENPYLHYLYPIEIEPFKDTEVMWPKKDVLKECLLTLDIPINKAIYEHVIMAKFDE